MYNVGRESSAFSGLCDPVRGKPFPLSSQEFEIGEVQSIPKDGDAALYDGDKTAIIELATRTLHYVIDRKKPEQKTVVSKWDVRISTRLTPAVLQVGPSCGFAAIAVVGQILQDTRSTARGLPRDGPSEMISWAREKSFTTVGEMFSSATLLQVLRNFHDCDANLQKLPPDMEESDEASAACVEKFVQQIDTGSIALVPYDKGPNNEPAWRSGQSAHWCAVIGLVKFCRSEEKIDVRSWKDEIYAICRHGKSAHYALWKVWDLLTSCAALLKIRALDRPAHFIVSDPEDLQDIRGQLIFVKCGGEVWTHSFSSDDSNAL